MPGAPGTYGSAVGVGIYYIAWWADRTFIAAFWPKEYGVQMRDQIVCWALNGVLLTAFCLVGIWASGRTAPIFGRKDPSQAVVDEVMGQLITFCFVPFGVSWPFVLIGFLLFRTFDILKPFPCRAMESLPGGLGIWADDMVAGVYAGVCLSLLYALNLFS